MVVSCWKVEKEQLQSQSQRYARLAEGNIRKEEVARSTNVITVSFMNNPVIEVDKK